VFFKIFKALIDKFYNQQEMDVLLRKLDKKTLQEIYTHFWRQIEERKIDFYKYISAEELYQMYTREVEGYQEEAHKGNEVEEILRAIEAQIAVDQIVKHLDKEVEKMGGIHRWIKEKGITRKNNEYANKALLERIIKEDDEKKNEEDGKLLRRIGFDSNYLIKYTRQIDESRDYWFEHSLYDAVCLVYKDGGMVLNMPMAINQKGYSGSTGEEFQVPRFIDHLKSFIKSILFRFKFLSP
jgi:hypothetical protein